MPEDLDAPATRAGLGFDVHPFVPDDPGGRPLFLGGVRFEDEPGLVGHSDGDAVCHAVADALLGAVGAGDVGEHFPDTDPSVKGISGTVLLAATVAIARDHGWRPVWCDVTVVAGRPAIAPRRDELRAALAVPLGLGADSISVKATRPEGLGLSGDGIGCLALVTVTRTTAS
jgi:2-C-methyl-D-erythritol 2,4-cyclodiphosphate synthase